MAEDFILRHSKIRQRNGQFEKVCDRKKTAIVNVYELSEEWSGFRVLSFEKENEKWLDFVCACRKGQSLNKEYDIIIGNVADDDVFKTVDMYFRGLWNKEKVLNELRYYKMNNQICIVKPGGVGLPSYFPKGI